MPFGTLITAADVHKAVADTLQLWFPTYLAERERDTDRDAGSLVSPRSYVPVSEVERWPEEQLPSVLVAIPAVANPPEKTGAKVYRATWRCDITIVVGAADDVDTLVADYVAVIRQLMVQQHSLGGLAAACDWTGERYDVLGARQRRHLAAGTATFAIEVRDVVSWGDVPALPPVDPLVPLADGPSVQTTEVQVNPAEEDL